MNLAPLANAEPWVQTAAALLLLAVLAVSARFIMRQVLLRLLGRLRDGMHVRWLQIFLDDRVLRRLAQLIPWVIIQMGIGAVPHLHPPTAVIISNVAVALTVLYSARVLAALLDAVLHTQQYPADGLTAASGPTSSIKSYVQLLKLLIYAIASIIIIAALIDRSPLILLSGLGAMSAVLLLVFKDTLLSFTAGVQLSSNDMLRVGDWIDMPQVGADGYVIDIALHTVKVQNWDKTITTIPTWRLMSESYRNWRGMFTSGGRRIKRSIRIDASTIGFLDAAAFERLSRIALLRQYLEEKHREVLRTNDEYQTRLGEIGRLPANQRRLTNIGTFRAYVEAYLRAHPGINQEMILMVRTLEPTPEGAPLELYCFTSSTAWIDHEKTQADIFDHLLAILPEFGLALYQSPTGSDMRLALRHAAG
jgi:miniconductance mechanosensitive channel